MSTIEETDLQRIATRYREVYSRVRFNPARDEVYKGVYQILSTSQPRLEPLLLLLTCDALGGNVEEALPAAYAMEMLHYAMLAHEASFAHGRTRLSLRDDFDANSAIIGGDILVVLAYRYLVEVDRPYLLDVLATVNQATKKMIEGHYLSTELPLQEVVSTADHLKMIEYRDGVALGTAMEIGALLAGGDVAQKKYCRDCGSELGAYAAIQRELLSLSGEGATQEEVADDQLSFSLLLAMELVDDKRTEALKIIYRQSNDLEVRRDAILKYAGPEFPQQVQQRAQEHLNSAYDALEQAKTKTEAASMLNSLLTFVDLK